MNLIESVLKIVQQCSSAEFKVGIGGIDTEKENNVNFIAITDAGGANIVGRFYDGSCDKAYPFEILLQSKHQEKGIEAINKIAEAIEKINNSITSKNAPIEELPNLISINCENAEAFRGITKSNFYMFSIKAILTLYKESEN